MFSKHKVVITTFQLALIFTIFDVIAYNIPLFNNIFHLFNGSTNAKLFFTMQLMSAYIVLLWAALYLLFFKYFTKFLIVFICIGNSLALYFILTYQIVIDKNMMINALQTDKHEVLGLLTIKFFLYLLILGILPSILLTKVHVTYKPFFQEIFWKVTFFIVAMIVAGVIILPAYKTISAFTRQNNNTIVGFLPLPYISSSISLAKIYLTPLPKFVTTTEGAKLSPAWNKINKQNTVFVFILGETAREKNFSLYGYPKDTNFFLKNEKLVLFHNTQSCGTATATSVPCMFSNLNRSNFSIKKAKYQDDLLDILQKVSFDVLWIENQGGCKNVCNRVRTHKIKHQKISTYEGAYDDVVVAELKEQIPVMLKHKQPKLNVVVLYISDHGESLGENGMYLHGFPYKLAPKEQTTVPFFMWFSSGFKKSFRLSNTCLNSVTKKQYSQDNIYHSILGLLKVESSTYNKNLDIFSICK